MWVSGSGHIPRRKDGDAGKFDLYTDSQGKYRFRLKAGNGETIAVGEAYESKVGALNGINSIRRNATDAVLVDQTGS